MCIETLSVFTITIIIIQKDVIIVIGYHFLQKHISLSNMFIFILYGLAKAPMFFVYHYLPQTVLPSGGTKLAFYKGTCIVSMCCVPLSWEAPTFGDTW